MAPVISLDNPAFQHRVVGIQLLTAGPQTQVIQSAERGQVSRAEGSVTHVEVFQVGGVGTSIIERPRPSPRHRRANRYTLNCDEPLSYAMSFYEVDRAAHVWLTERVDASLPHVFGSAIAATDVSDATVASDD